MHTQASWDCGCLFTVGESKAAEMLKSFDESSTSPSSCLAGEAENDATICTTGNVLSLGFQKHYNMLMLNEI